MAGFVRLAHLCSRNGRPARRVSFRWIHIHRPCLMLWFKHDGWIYMWKLNYCGSTKRTHTVHPFVHAQKRTEQQTDVAKQSIFILAEWSIKICFFAHFLEYRRLNLRRLLCMPQLNGGGG